MGIVQYDGCPACVCVGGHTELVIVTDTDVVLIGRMEWVWFSVALVVVVELLTRRDELGFPVELMDGPVVVEGGFVDAATLLVEDASTPTQ